MNGGRAGSEHIKDYPQSAYMYKRIDEFDRGKISGLGPHKMESDGPCPRWNLGVSLYMYYYLIGGNVTEVASKTLIDPSIAPPVTSNVVPEPFVGELVGDQGGCVVLVRHDRFPWVQGKVQFSANSVLVKNTKLHSYQFEVLLFPMAF